jgi:hypothetical protein
MNPTPQKIEFEYFENKEDYEKCDFLSKLQIPN